MSDHIRRLRPLHICLATVLLYTSAAWAQPTRGPEEPRTWLTVDGHSYEAGSTLDSEVGVSTLAVLGGQWVSVSRRFHVRGALSDATSDGNDTAPVRGAFAQLLLTAP